MLSANKARFIWNNPSRPLTPVFFSPCTKFSSGHIKHPILSHDAEPLEKVQNLAPKFVKGLWHVLYETALQQLQLDSLTHRWIRGGLMSMFKITHGLLDFLMESTFTHPTHKGLRGHAYTIHRRRCCTRRLQYAFSVRAIPFWNKLPADIVNASLMKPFKTLLDANWQSLLPEVPI